MFLLFSLKTSERSIGICIGGRKTRRAGSDWPGLLPTLHLWEVTLFFKVIASSVSQTDIYMFMHLTEL